MAWETIAAGVVILSLAVLWYGLQAVALRDLRTRPRVRGDNKLLWAFAILCVPYVGALGYLSMGPTSFLPRTGRVRPAGAVTGRPAGSAGRPVGRSGSGRTASRDPGPTKPGDLRDRRAPLAAPPGAAGSRPARLAVDPIIGTDSANLIPVRPSRARRPPPPPADAIRWPGSGVTPGWQYVDADVQEDR